MVNDALRRVVWASLGWDGWVWGLRKPGRVHDCSYMRSGNLEKNKLSRTHIQRVRVFGGVDRVGQVTYLTTLFCFTGPAALLVVVV
jgi:hypothetical protein